MGLGVILLFHVEITNTSKYIRNGVGICRRLREIQSLIQIQKTARIISHFGIDLTEGSINANDGDIVLRSTSIQLLVQLQRALKLVDGFGLVAFTQVDFGERVESPCATEIIRPSARWDIGGLY